MGRRHLRAAGVGPRGTDALDAGKLDGRNAALGGSSVELPACLPSRRPLTDLPKVATLRLPPRTSRSATPRDSGRSALIHGTLASAEPAAGRFDHARRESGTDPRSVSPPCSSVAGNGGAGNAGPGRKRGMGGHGLSLPFAPSSGWARVRGKRSSSGGRGRGETPGKPISVSLCPEPSDRRCARTGCSARPSHERRAASPGARRSLAPRRARLVTESPRWSGSRGSSSLVALHGLVHGEGVRHRARRAARRGGRAPSDLGREDAAQVGRDSRGAERRRSCASRDWPGSTALSSTTSRCVSTTGVGSPQSSSAASSPYDWQSASPSNWPSPSPGQHVLVSRARAGSRIQPTDPRPRKPRRLRGRTRASSSEGIEVL